MCGLCGIVYNNPRAVGPVSLVAMRDALIHRGPDDAGLWTAPGIALGSRRLSVLDLSPNGHMPMSTEDGRYHIVYNGEIYNFRDLRRELSAAFSFKSNGDTEVLLKGFVHQGPAFLEKLNGMFAIAIWDDREKSLFLARDRLGVKPLYYSEIPEALIFASEEKALLKMGIKPEFDSGAWEELLCFRYVAGENTPFRGIKKLLPGHFLIWKNGKIKIKRWWHLGERARALRENLPPDPLSWFLETFDQAVDIRRISDVPLGVFLSGGLDSSSVAASLAIVAKQPPETFSMRFSDPAFDEWPLIQKNINRWNFKSHSFEIGPGDLLSLLEKASWFNDEPLAHGNDHYLYSIAREAKKSVTVLLSGEGADETLGGYVRYRPFLYKNLLTLSRYVLPPAANIFKIKGRLGKLASFLRLCSMDRMILFNACNIFPHQLREWGFPVSENFPYREAVLEEGKNYSPEPVRQAMYSDQHTFLCSLLDRNDRMTMGASIECRTPFLDYRLVEMAAALPTRELFEPTRGKKILRNAMTERLPIEILNHKKWGFGVPWNPYLRREKQLRDFLIRLPDEEPFCSGPLDRQILRARIKNFLEGEDRDSLFLLQLLMISVWHGVFFKNKPEAVRS